ncbi:hypothetical protein OAH34_00735 [bacterium]|nr:hypothetical protein [bacterium]
MKESRQDCKPVKSRSLTGTMFHEKGFIKQFIAIGIACFMITHACHAETTTWDHRYSTEKIELTVVYFVPSDRTPLVDWRDRVDYYCRRIEQFHEREFGDQSVLETKVVSSPFQSSQSTKQLRVGDANAIYFKTLAETAGKIKFNENRKDKVFPILLVLSEINWRPLDDFYRLRPSENGPEFEGNYRQGQHFPGAASGGARASYQANQGVGWGLVSADGWRVPYRGSDCVVYHEGCGHTVGLPHPDAANGSVMALGQYQGWISESWLDQDQKERLNWKAIPPNTSDGADLFSSFTALPFPRVPRPEQPVRLQLEWPDAAKVDSIQVRFQTSIDGPWINVPQSWESDAPESVPLGQFDRPTPVSYRVDARLENGETAELWGYLQVRAAENLTPMPRIFSDDLQSRSNASSVSVLAPVDLTEQRNLLKTLRINDHWKQGEWLQEEKNISSPKIFGARMELPKVDFSEYRMTLIVEPLDEPNALLLGNRLNGNRFATLFGYNTPSGHKSAVENINGRNVGNETTYTGNLFRKDEISQVIVQVKENQLLMMVDGQIIVDWRGPSEKLSLSDYWQTPNGNALFLGSYDCRFRFHQILISPISINNNSP